MCFGERNCAICPQCGTRSWTLRWYRRGDGSFCTEGSGEVGSCAYSLVHPWVIYSETHIVCPECVQRMNNVPEPFDENDVPEQQFHPDDTRGIVARALHHIQDPNRGNFDIVHVPEHQLGDQIAAAEAENAWRRSHREEVNALNAALGMVPRQSEVRMGDTTDWHDTSSAVRFRSRDNSMTRFLRAPANTPMSNVPQTPIPENGGFTPLHDAPVTPGPQLGSFTPMYQVPAPSPFMGNSPLPHAWQSPDGAVTPVNYLPSPSISHTPATIVPANPRTPLQTILEDPNQTPYSPAYQVSPPPVVNTPLPSYNQAAAATPPPPIDLLSEDAVIDPTHVLQEYATRIGTWMRPVRERLSYLTERQDVTASTDFMRAAIWVLGYIDTLYTRARRRANAAPWEDFEQARLWMLEVIDNPDNYVPSLVRRVTEWTRLIRDELTRHELGIQETARHAYMSSFDRQERRYRIRQGERNEDEIGELIRMEMHEEEDFRIQNMIYGRADMDISFDNHGRVNINPEDDELLDQMIRDLIPEEEQMELEEPPM